MRHKDLQPATVTINQTPTGIVVLQGHPKDLELDERDFYPMIFLSSDQDAVVYIHSQIQISSAAALINESASL